MQQSRAAMIAHLVVDKKTRLNVRPRMVSRTMTPLPYSVGFGPVGSSSVQAGKSNTDPANSMHISIPPISPRGSCPNISPCIALASYSVEVTSLRPAHIASSMEMRDLRFTMGRNRRIAGNARHGFGAPAFPLQLLQRRCAVEIDEQLPGSALVVNLRAYPSFDAQRIFAVYLDHAAIPAGDGHIPRREILEVYASRYGGDIQMHRFTGEEYGGKIHVDFQFGNLELADDFPKVTARDIQTAVKNES